MIIIIIFCLKSALQTSGIVVTSAHYQQASLLVQLLGIGNHHYNEDEDDFEDHNETTIIKMSNPVPLDL